MKNLFDEIYYESGIDAGVSCYANYRWLPELTIPIAAHLVMNLGIKQTDKVLDFGCAKGFLVKALRLLHIDARGVDISKYAISRASKDVSDYVTLIEPDTEIQGGPYEWIVAKDVLEHITQSEIDSVLRKLRSITRSMFVVVPLGENGQYVIPQYEIDKTHQIRESLTWWNERFIEAGYIVEHASYHMSHIKDNWSEWEFGNGFFILRNSLCLR